MMVSNSILSDFIDIALLVYDEHNIHTAININEDISIEFFNGFNTSIEFLIDFDIKNIYKLGDIHYRLMYDGDYTDQLIKKTQSDKKSLYKLIIDSCLPQIINPLPDTWLVSYQYEAFPWDQWNIIEATELTEELNKPFSKSAGGITSVDYVYIKNMSKHEAMIEGGKILSDYVKQFNYPQFKL